MTVTVTEFKDLDPTCTSVDSIADSAGTGAGESDLAILFHALYNALNRGAAKASRAL